MKKGAGAKHRSKSRESILLGYSTKTQERTRSCFLPNDRLLDIFLPRCDSWLCAGRHRRLLMLRMHLPRQLHIPRIRMREKMTLVQVRRHGYTIRGPHQILQTNWKRCVSVSANLKLPFLNFNSRSIFQINAHLMLEVHVRLMQVTIFAHWAESGSRGAMRDAQAKAVRSTAALQLLQSESGLHSITPQ